MKTDSARSRNRVRALACGGLSFLFSIGVLTASAQTNRGELHRRPIAVRNDALHGTRLNEVNGEVELFVRFDQPSVAEINIASLQQSGKFAAGETQKAQAARVAEQQAQVRPLIEALGARILSSQRVAANGVRVRAKASQIGALRALPGVRSVGHVIAHSVDGRPSRIAASSTSPDVQGQAPANIDSVPWIGAPKVWSQLGIKGQGIRVGIIDTGIDYTHANFGGSGTPAAYAANNPSVVEPGSFPTAKVVGGYDFAGPTYTAGDEPQPDSDPLDGDGHGSHVAGTVAGVGVANKIGPGVAPEAQLYALKVFGDAAGTTTLTSLAIEWAMDPNGDGDMSDHLDVINMSLGSAFGDPNDPSSISANNAADVGVIVVTSAGNEGAMPYITGAPGVASQAISTAASTPGGRLYAKLTVTAPSSVAGVKPAEEGAGPVRVVDVSPLVDDLVPSVPANGCTAFTNAAAVSNNIVLIARGSCAFAVKFQNAQAAGARAVVMYNNAAGDPIVMGGLEAASIPGVMTTQAVGQALAAASGVQVRLEAASDPSKDDRIGTFSSQGPGQMNSSFKPDLSAPGVGIVSTAVGTGTGAANYDGTSMAAPHAAGAAALLRQKHPKLDQAVIKALLQNSTVSANSSYDDSLTRQGVGVLRVDRAASLTSYAMPAGVSFGRINPLLPTWRSEKVKVGGLTHAWRSFAVTHVPNRTLPGVEVTCPQVVRVFGKMPATVHVSLRFDPRASAEAGVADDGIVSQTEIDGWCVLNDGKDELRVGYIAVVDPASNVFVTPSRGLQSAIVRNGGPALGWAEGFTLAKLGGEELDRTFNAIPAFGFRRADPTLYGYDVLELGLATERPFTHISNLIVDILIDHNSDGEPDLELLAIDLSYLDPTVDPGTYVSVQFDLASEDAFIDWEVRSWDFNDRAAILPFTLASSGGFVPEKFDYTMYVVNGNDNSQDVQGGSIDLSKEIRFDVNSFGVGPKDTVEVNMSGGKGVSLWLFQNNQAAGQVGLTLSK